MATILLVEDEAVLAETLRYNFQREGYEVLVASDGVQALDLARSEHPDLMSLMLCCHVWTVFPYAACFDASPTCRF